MFVSDCVWVTIVCEYKCMCVYESIMSVCMNVCACEYCVCVCVYEEVSVDMCVLQHSSRDEGTCCRFGSLLPHGFCRLNSHC